MTDAPPGDFTDRGGQRALWLALVGAVRAHPDPQRAVRAALSAVEVERVRLLNTPGTPDAWLDALQGMHEDLKRFLAAEFP